MTRLVYEFGEFRLDVQARTLSQNENELPVTAKEFEALLVLVEKSGTAVSKELLVERLWGSNAQREQSNISKHIGALRKKLGGAEHGQTYIRTLPNAGYYFSAEVRNVVIEPPVMPVSGANELAALENFTESAVRLPAQAPADRWRPRAIWAAVLLAAAGIAALTAWTVERLVYRRAIPPRPSVAVLTFQNRSEAKDTDWLSNAVPAMLRMQLAAESNIHVISAEDVARMSSELSLPKSESFSKGTLARILRNLDADFLVLGSYGLLPSGKELWLDIRLLDTRSGNIIATASVRGSQTLLVDLAFRGGSTLRTTLGGRKLSHSEEIALKNSIPENLEATRLYAEGLAQLQMFSPVKARELLESAAAHDPQSPSIRSALAEAWASLGYETRAREEARTGFENISRLTSRADQLAVEGRYRELGREWPRAITVYQSLWTFFPDDLEHGLHLARTEIAAGRAHDALQLLKQISTDRRFGNDPRIDLEEAQAAEALGNFSQELEAAERSIKKGQQREARLLVARAQLKACWALDYLGHRSRALEFAKSAQRTFAELEDKGGEAQAIKNVADIMDDDGDHSGAIAVYKEALARFGAIGSQTGTVVTLNNMGYAIKDTGDLDSAAISFAESAKICRDIGDPAREAQALNSLGGVYWRRGKLALAETTFGKAMSEFEQTDDKHRAAVAKGNLGLVMKDEGRLSEAQSMLEQAFQLSRQTGDETGMADASGNEGDLLLKRGELFEATKKYEQQLSIGNKIDEDKQRAYAYYGLGRILLTQDDLDKAMEQFKYSLDLRLRHHENGLAAESRLGIAEVMIEKNDGAALVEARAADDQFGKEREFDQDAEATALLLRALISATPKTRTQCERAMEHLNELLPNLQDPASRIAASLTIAQYDATIGQREKARRTARDAFDRAKQLGYFDQQLEAALLAADLNADPIKRTRALDDVGRQASAKRFSLIARKALLFRERTPLNLKRSSHRSTVLVAGK